MQRSSVPDQPYGLSGMTALGGLASTAPLLAYNIGPDKTADPPPLKKATPMLRDAINTSLKEAMKAKDERRVSTLRMVNAALKNADIEARGNGKDALGDDALLGLMQRMIKQRQESVELYEKGGRAELADQERAEIAIISAYLPKQMDEVAMQAAIDAAVAESGASGIKDMGKVIGALKAKHAGQMDFAKASALVKARLSGG